MFTPGCYVGAPPQEDDGVPFEEKIAQLTATLKDQFIEGEGLEAEIGRNLAGLAMGFRNMVMGQK